MPNFKTIQRSDLRAIAADINAALETVGEKHGITLTTGNSTYSDRDFTMRLKGVVCVGDDGEAIDGDQLIFERESILIGVSADKYGTTFDNLGKTFTICGLNRKAKKYPIIAKDAAGKKYKFPAAVAQ